MLLSLDRLGTPFFSAGLSIAGMRLGEYLDPDEPLDMNEDQRRQATILLRRLTWLGMHAVPGEPIVKLADFDPGDAQQYQEFWQSTEE
jgi:hypothetical protein